MKQKTIYVFGLLFVLLSVISCKDDEFLKREDCVKNGYEEVSKEETGDDVFSLEEAEKIATAFFDKAGKNGLRSGKEETSISEMYAIKALDSIDLYVFNRKDGGFVLINPIKRSSSRILAYSDKDCMSKEMLNSEALSIWRDYIMDCLLNQDQIASKGESNTLNRASRASINRPFPPEIAEILEMTIGNLPPHKKQQLLDYLRRTDIENVITSPIIKTQWSQGYPYNYDCPNGCPAGCVAISVGQTINYYKKWNGESWNFNKINKSELPDIGKYIREIGRGLKMIYKPSGSYPDWGNLHFITDLNYREVSFLKGIGYWAKSYTVNSDGDKLIKEISIDKRPVIMNGYSKQFIVPYEGHSWIADGLKSLTTAYIMNEQQAADNGFIFELVPYEEIPVKYLLDEDTNHYLHFNMGWGGSNNTWYLYVGGIAGKSFKYNHHIKFIIVKG